MSGIQASPIAASLTNDVVASAANAADPRLFTAGAPDVAYGGSIAASGTGVPLSVTGTVSDPSGTQISNATIEVWEVDGDGLYDVRYEGRTKPDGRGRDGPVGTMLANLGRHTMRPAHLHFMLAAPGFATLTTAIDVNGNPYVDGDAVFGVTPSLVGTYVRTTGPGGPPASLHRDFVLVGT